MNTNIPERAKILVVDDDASFIDLITSCLHSAEVQTCPDGTIPLSLTGSCPWDLVILDIAYEEKSGFDICEHIRSQDPLVPILFASRCSDFKSRIAAYGSGGNDYIPKPCECEELKLKVSSLLRISNAPRKAVLETQGLVLQTQTECANLQAINRFVLTSSHCKTLDSLNDLAMHTLRELGVEAVLSINGFEVKSTCGEVRLIEREILEMSGQLPRIYSFGKRRALFSWSNAQMLVRNIKSYIDLVAIMMDAMEASILRISSQRNLLDQAMLLEESSIENKLQIESLFNQVTDEISSELTRLGIVSSLSIEEEEMLQEKINGFHAQAQRVLEQQGELNTRLKHTIKELVNESESFKKTLQELVGGSEDQSGAVELW